MSNYRICIINAGQHGAVEHINFDNKEDAEHEAKNKSLNDNQHRYEIQKNNHGEFMTIKAYQNGQVV